MVFIYKITNDINNHSYIGQTQRSLTKRFAEHCRDYQRVWLTEKRPLYNAMRKYGIEHFHIELLEECLEELLEEREQYWINYYDTYYNGYNATKGGEGKPLYDYDEILNKLKEIPNSTLIAKEIGCSVDTVRMVAQKNNISLKPNLTNNTLKAKSKCIYQYDLNNNLIQCFESTVAASEYLYENGICKNYNSGIRAHLSEAARGKRKTAYGFIWSYELKEDS